MNAQNPTAGVAPKIAVDPHVFYIIAQVESSGFSGAMRFEPKVYADIKGIVTGGKPQIAAGSYVLAIAKANYCTLETAEVLYSTSYGLYQLMGYNLYRLGLHTPLSQFLNSRQLQDDLFGKFLADRGINFTWKEMDADPAKLARFAEHYNGSVAYGARMRSVAKTLGV